MTNESEPSADRHSSSRRSTGGRPRHPNQAIADIIQEIPRGVHLTAPEVYRRARESGLKISLSTVYRTLNQLQAGGNVSTVAGDHGRRYEARNADHDHDHLICLKCGLTIEFEDDLIRGFGKSLAERKGYDHQSSRFDILGICPECRAKDEDHKISSCIDALNKTAAITEQLTPQFAACITLLEARKVAKSQELISALIQSLEQGVEELQAALDGMRPVPDLRSP